MSATVAVVGQTTRCTGPDAPLTGQDLLTDSQRERLPALFADPRHIEVQQTATVHQQMVAAYRLTGRSTPHRL